MQPITTVFHSEPTSGCSVRRVQTIFAGNGLALRIDVPETDRRSPLLSVLVPDGVAGPRPEISVFRSLAAAKAAAQRLGSRAGTTRALIARQGNVVVVRGAHMAARIVRSLSRIAPELSVRCK